MKITSLQADKLVNLLLVNTLLGDFEPSSAMNIRFIETLRDPNSDITLSDSVLEIAAKALLYTIRFYEQGISLSYTKDGQVRGCANRQVVGSKRELTFAVQEILDTPQINAFLGYEEERIVVKLTDQDGNENTIADPSALRAYVAHRLINGVEMSSIHPAAIAAGVMLQRAIELNRQLDTTLDAALGNQSEGV